MRLCFLNFSVLPLHGQMNQNKSEAEICGQVRLKPRLMQFAVKVHFLTGKAEEVLASRTGIEPVSPP